MIRNWVLSVMGLAFLLALAMVSYEVYLERSGIMDLPSQSRLGITPPVADVRTTNFTLHGITLRDDYSWLKDESYPSVDDEDVLAYLNAENDYYDAVMGGEAELTTQIFEEIKARIKEDDASVPTKDGNWEYWWAFEPGAQYRRWFRRPVGGGEDQLMLDEVARAEGHDYFAVGDISVSPDGRLMAWSEDVDGSERHVIRIQNLESGAVLGDQIANTSGSAVWAADSSSFFYTELSESLRPYRVRHHRLGDAPDADRQVYEEVDEGFFVGIGKTHSREFIVIGTGDHITSEIYIIPATAPGTAPAVIAPRRDGHEYSIDHGNGLFFIRTNDRHKNFRIVTASQENPAEGGWQELQAASETSYIRGLTVFGDFLVVQERGNALDRIRIRRHSDGGTHEITFPEIAYSASLGNTPEFDTNVIRLGYTSMVTPQTVYDYDVTTLQLTTRKVQEIPSGYDPSRYRSERLWATARDGVRVPITILTRDDYAQDGSGFLHLTAYGAYGLGNMPRFSLARLSLVDRGFAFAIVHVRGGDEMGYGWYEDGKLDRRTNTFHDFVDSARHLVSDGWAASGSISASGGSAGGELMGYVVNSDPDLWRAVVAHVPFVDVLNTMLDTTLPLTPMEWPEWGNPIEDDTAFKHILSYSPYDNVSEQDYPNLFVTAGLNDPRVTYWEPAKWVAKLRALKTDDNILVLKTNMGHGHFGQSGRFNRFHEVAEEYAFILKAFGMAKPKTGAP